MDNLAQTPDHVKLPKSLRLNQIPKCLLTRIRNTIANSIFDLIGKGKLKLKILSSGIVDLTLPYGLWRAVVPVVLKRLEEDSFGSGSIADLLVRLCGRYRQIGCLLRYY